MPIHAQFYRLVIWRSKVGQGGLVFDGSLVGLCVQDYKSLCTAVTICATLVVPFDSYILTPVSLKSGPNPTSLYIHVRCTHDANLVTAGSRDTTHKYFCDRLKPMKVGQGDLLFDLLSGASNGKFYTATQHLTLAKCV